MISIPIGVKLNNPNVSYLDNPEVTFLCHFLTPIGMYNLNRIGADRVDLGKSKSTLSAPYLSSFYQCYLLIKINILGSLEEKGPLELSDSAAIIWEEMPNIMRRRNSEDDNVLEDKEEAAEEEAALDL